MHTDLHNMNADNFTTEEYDVDGNATHGYL